MNKKQTIRSPPPLASFVLRSFTSGVNCVKYDLQDPLRLYASDQQGTIHIFNLRSRSRIHSISNAHQSTIFSLNQFDNSIPRLISFGKDGFIKIWNENGQCQWDFQTNHCSFSNCDTIGSSLIVAPIGSEQSAVAAFDPQSSNPVVKRFIPIVKEKNFGMVMKLRVLNENRLCVAYENGSVMMFDISSMQPIDSYQVTSDHEPITAMDVFNQTCLCGTTKSDLISLDFNEMKFQPTSTFRSVEMPNAGTAALRCRPDDGKIIALAGWDFRIRLFRRETGKQLAMLDHHRQQVHDIDFSHQTQQMACASEDRTVSIWDIYNGNKTAASS